MKNMTIFLLSVGIIILSFQHRNNRCSPQVVDAELISIVEDSDKSRDSFLNAFVRIKNKGIIVIRQQEVKSLAIIPANMDLKMVRSEVLSSGDTNQKIVVEYFVKLDPVDYDMPIESPMCL
tara:strand:- start:653 stop:1015 length:363 start_codon:yes stop_codon:yes gene_type:complete